MKFSHDFTDDLTVFLDEISSKRPFAFTKFADGERLLLGNVPHHLSKQFEQWDSGEETEFTRRLRASLTADLPGYHIGISCPCCSDSSGYKHGVLDSDFYLSQIKMPMDRVTFANILVNGNYGRWEKFAIGQEVILVSSSPSATFSVPKNAVNCDISVIDGIIEAIVLDERDLPVFVAAGPAGCIIVHEAWQRTCGRRTIIDVGSTLDPFIHGGSTRSYHDPSHPNRHKICRWTLDNAI